MRTTIAADPLGTGVTTDDSTTLWKMIAAFRRNAATTSGSSAAGSFLTIQAMVAS